jgi:glucose-6-phosphate 1-dehydrogenase
MFGATGDAAYKKIFPAVQVMVKRGHLDVPVIGVAKAGWDLEQFRARAKDRQAPRRRPLRVLDVVQPAAFIVCVPSRSLRCRWLAGDRAGEG